MEDKDPKELSKYTKERIKNIESKRDFRDIYLERALNRNHYLEAMKQYHSLILTKVVEALRLLHCP